MNHSPVSINELNEIINQIAINLHFDFIFSLSSTFNLIENELNLFMFIVVYLYYNIITINLYKWDDNDRQKLIVIIFSLSFSINSFFFLLFNTLFVVRLNKLFIAFKKNLNFWQNFVSKSLNQQSFVLLTYF